MEHTEKKDAMAAMDGVAAEIHHEYVKAAEQMGQRLPPWEQIPDSAKTMCRTLARLMLTKMEKVYFDAKETVNKDATAEIAVLKAELAAAKVATPKADPSSILKQIQAQILEALDRYGEIKVGNPLEKGIDAAIEMFSQKLALEVLSSSPELVAKLKDNVIGALTAGLLDDKEE